MSIILDSMPRLLTYRVPPRGLAVIPQLDIEVPLAQRNGQVIKMDVVMEVEMERNLLVMTSVNLDPTFLSLHIVGAIKATQQVLLDLPME